MENRDDLDDTLNKSLFICVKLYLDFLVFSKRFSFKEGHFMNFLKAYFYSDDYMNYYNKDLFPYFFEDCYIKNNVKITPENNFDFYLNIVSEESNELFLKKYDYFFNYNNDLKLGNKLDVINLNYIEKLIDKEL